MTSLTEGFPGGSAGKASTCSAGDWGSIRGLGRSPGEGNGNPLQYSCLANSMDRGGLWPTVNGVTKSQTQLSDFTLLQKLSQHLNQLYSNKFFKIKKKKNNAVEGVSPHILQALERAPART